MRFAAAQEISHCIAMMTEVPVPLSKIRISIHSSSDIFVARQEGRALAKALDFSTTEATLLATILSELGRDILAHAYSGEITLEPLQRGRRVGISFTAAYADGSIAGTPKVPEPPDAIADWFLLAKVGAGHLWDEMKFDSEPGPGVALTGIKWRG